MRKSAEEVLQGVLMHAYDPAKAHDYYLRVRELKGRHPGAKVIPLASKGHVPKAPSHDIPPGLQAQVDHLTNRLHELQARLREILSKAQKPAKSDHKTAADKSKDARASKQYRDKHKAEIAQKQKSKASKSGGGSSSGGGVSSMSETEVRAAIARTKTNLQNAVAQARAAANR